MAATNEQLVIDFLVDPKGQKALENIGKAAKDSATQVKELIALLQQASATTGADPEQTIRGFRQYTNIQQSARAQLQTPMGYNKQWGGDIPANAQVNESALNQIEGLTAAQSAAHDQKMAQLAAEQVQMEAYFNANKEQVIATAQLENTHFDQKKARLLQEQQLYAVIAEQRKTIEGITALTPANQVSALSSLVPQMSESSGVPVQTILKEIEKSFNVLPGTSRKVTDEIRGMQNGLAGTAKEAFNLRSIFSNLFSSMVIGAFFTIIMGIVSAFKQLIDQANTFAGAIAKLSAVESIMSNAGISVTGKQLLDMVDNLEKKFTLISHIDMLQATSDAALRLSDMGMSAEDLRKLMEVANVAKITNPGKTLPDATQQIGTGILTGEQKSVASLGFHMTQAETQAMGVQLGLIKDITVQMTEQQKAKARLLLLYEQTTAKEKEALGMQENLSNAGEKFSKSWSGLLQAASPVVNVWNEIVYLVSIVLTGLGSMISVLSGAAKATTPLQQAVKYIFDIGSKLSNIIPAVAIWNGLMWSIAKAYEIISGRKISDQTPDALLNKDTPTGTPSDSNADNSASNAEKIKSALKSLNATIRDFGEKARDAQQKFNDSMKKMAEDFAIEQSRALSDYLHERAKTISDSEDAIRNKERDYQQKKKEDEAKFQEQLRQLREKYLLDVEDAAHERDARAVLKLARDYAMNKNNLINEHNNQMAQNEQQHRQDMADLIKQRNDRLKELDYEYRLKAARAAQDYALKQARAIADHQQEMKRLEQEKQDKLRDLADSIAQQLNMNQQGADAIYQMLNGYYGPGGAIDGLMKFTYNNSVQYIDALMKRLMEYAKQYQNMSSPPPGGGGTNSQSAGGMADGGLMVANKATNVTFGEKSKELAFFLPLNKLSSFLGASSSGGSNQQAANGKMELLVTLSPDLETRIVSRAHDETSQAIMQVRRGR